MKITLNLATKPYADQRPAIKQLRIGMAVLAGVLLLIGLGLLHLHHSALVIAAKEDQINRQIEQVQREQTSYRAQMQQPANARVLQQAQFLNGLFDEKSFSWTAAMEDLERVLPAGVQVTAIEPSRGKDGRITLHLRVAGLRERAVEMLRNMEHSRRFTAPRISGENAENESQNGLQQVRDTGPAKVSFDVLAEYNPVTLEERKAEIAGQKHPHSDSGEKTESPKKPDLSARAQGGSNAAPGRAPAPGPRASAKRHRPLSPGEALRRGAHPSRSHRANRPPVPGGPQ